MKELSLCKLLGLCLLSLFNPWALGQEAVSGAPTDGRSYTLETAPLELVQPKRASQPDTDACQLSPLVKLGRGYNTLTGCFRGNSVVPEPKSDENEKNGQHVEYSLTQIENYYELRNYLGISSSASFDTGVYGGSFSASYMKAVQMHRYSNYLLVMVQVTNSVSGLDKFVLEPEAKKLTKEVGPANFLQRFGDTFVVSTVTGGRFAALVEFLSEDRAEQEAIKVDLKAHAGKFEGAGDFEQALSTVRKDVVTRIKVMKEGGINSIPQTADLIKTALEFPEEVNVKTGHPVLYGFGSADYSQADWPAEIALPSSLNTQKRTLDHLTSDRDEILTLTDDIEYIKQNPGQFEKYDIASLNAKTSILDGYLKTVNEAANSLLDNPLNPFTYPTIDFQKIRPLPVRESGQTIPLTIMATPNGYSPMKTVDNTWAGITGSGRALQMFSVATQQKIAGLGISYDARFICSFAAVPVRTSHGEDGQEAAVPPRNGTYLECWLNAFSLALTGRKAKYYDVKYTGYYHSRGEVQTSQNGELVSVGNATSDQVEAIRVWVVAK